MMDFLTLSELNALVADCIKDNFPDTYWVIAETSDVRVNQSGHCYLELIEKSQLTGAVVAKARSYIWNQTFRMLKPLFEEKTGQSFGSGLKILIKAVVDFHPNYGYGINILDIDPAYTLGETQLRRQQILNQLKEEGVLEMNKELPMPLTPQRIAVITSATAAGYEDFLAQLHHNPQGFVFYPKLFPAVMQGEQTESAILSALDQIFAHVELFDVVAIVRGGGATSDLAAFDSYLTAAACAQFPLPVITGIGHERDDTVLDMVAHYKAKTPTAVADYLIHCMATIHEQLLDTESSIHEKAKERLSLAADELRNLTFSLQHKSLNLIEKNHSSLELIQMDLKNRCMQLLSTHQHQLTKWESVIQLSSPQYILAKGYSITRFNGKALKSTNVLRPGDQIETQFREGTLKSVVVSG
ncbi:MAG: exodeoxyribonuclease VII large subunit [Dysgonamonadaceae bacterium]|jgi:exodeoxyribonuclease VII large subunit|nr:exodeoxyribonuclease VII large subunit [Dysgonamonadaceae bacterium]